MLVHDEPTYSDSPNYSLITKIFGNKKTAYVYVKYSDISSNEPGIAAVTVLRDGLRPDMNNKSLQWNEIPVNLAEVNNSRLCMYCTCGLCIRKFIRYIDY